jgi:hypothetical protein
VLWATWDRAARRLAAVVGGAVTGPATVARGAAFAGAPFAPGLSRDWYAHAAEAGVVELVAPRGGACTGALWGVVAAAPCRARAGLAAALAPAALLGAPWQRVAWRAARGGCGAESGACATNLSVEVQFVVGGGSGAGGWRTGLALPEDWGAPGGRPAACALAATSALTLEAPGASPVVLPLASLAAAGGGAALAPLPAGMPPPPRGSGLFDCLSATRQLVADSPALGSGLVLLQVHNDCSGAAAAAPWANATLEVREALPWMLVRVEGSGLWWWAAPGDGGGRAGALGEPRVLYRSPGGRPRGPATLHLTKGVPLPPPGATLSVSWRYAPSPHGLLHGEEGPPDASRGVELPPARLRVAGAGAALGEAEWWAHTLTGGGVVQQPAVDASMPYNVMVLASTVAAFVAGGLINALAREPKGPKKTGGAA